MWIYACVCLDLLVSIVVMYKSPMSKLKLHEIEQKFSRSCSSIILIVLQKLSTQVVNLACLLYTDAVISDSITGLARWWIFQLEYYPFYPWSHVIHHSSLRMSSEHDKSYLPCLWNSGGRVWKIHCLTTVHGICLLCISINNDITSNAAFLLQIFHTAIDYIPLTALSVMF